MFHISCYFLQLSSDTLEKYISMILVFFYYNTLCMVPLQKNRNVYINIYPNNNCYIPEFSTKQDLGD